MTWQHSVSITALDVVLLEPPIIGYIKIDGHIDTDVRGLGPSPYAFKSVCKLASRLLPQNCLD